MLGASKMHFLNGEDATARELWSSDSMLKCKRQNVSAKRVFPQNCGRYAPYIHPRPGKDGAIRASNESPKDHDLVAPLEMEGFEKRAVVSANIPFPGSCGRDASSFVKELKMKAVASAKRTFPDGCGRNVPSLSDAKLKMKAVLSAKRTFPDGCGRNAPFMSTKLKMEAVVSAKRTFPDGCGRNAKSIRADIVREGVISIKQLCFGVCEQHIQMSISIGVGDGLKSDGTCLETSPVEQPEATADLNEVYAVGVKIRDNDVIENMKDLVPNTAPESLSLDTSKQMHKISDQSPELDRHVAVETNVRKKYPPRRRISASRDIPSCCTTNASCSIEEVNSLMDSGMRDDKVCGPNTLDVLDKSESKKTREEIDEITHESMLQGSVEDVDGACIQSPHASISSQSDFESPPCIRNFSCSIMDVTSFRDSMVNEEIARGGEQEITESDKVRESRLQESVTCTTENEDEDCAKLVDIVHRQMTAHISVGEDIESRVTQEDMDCTSFQPCAESTFCFSDLRPLTPSEYVNGESGGPELVMESTRCSKERSLKRKFLGGTVRGMQEYIETDNSREKERTSKSPSGLGGYSMSCKKKKYEDDIHKVNHLINGENVGSELVNKRVIIQALMAAENCPWKLVKQKSTSDPSDASVERNETNHELVDRHQRKSLSRRETAKGEKTKLRTSKKNSHLTRNSSCKHADDIILIDSDDSSFHDGGDGCNIILIDSDDDREGDGCPAQTSRNTDLSLIPFDFHNSVDDAVVTCNEVKDSHLLVDEIDGKDTVLSAKKSHRLELSVIPFGLHHLVYEDNGDEAGVTRKSVRETLRLFHGIYRKLLKDAESKFKVSQGGGRFRGDLMAAAMVREKKKCVNTGPKFLGHVPGVEVGDEFHFRVELAIIGLHAPYQGGIDYLNHSGKMLATSVVASGGYADCMDSSDLLIYSGQGGIPIGKTKKAEDQKLERGNLSLKNSFDERSPVRVIRGYKETKGTGTPDSRGKTVATYVYDGLYFVESYWQDTSTYGTKVFKFQLRRVPGQPVLPMKEVKKSKRSRVHESLCVDDISQGKEGMPIRAINTLDDQKPPPFEYITSMIYPSSHNLVPSEGCQCTDGCTDSDRCACAMKNGGEIPFNFDGAIVEAKSLVYECGPSCKCSSSCPNRVSQRGIKFQLEIFKTESRGWGVRSLSSIPSGSFICEYTGELLEDSEAERRTGNDEYLFDIGQNYSSDLAKDNDDIDPSSFDSKSKSTCESEDEIGYTIDAATCGSVGRFVNHSCSPNLYAQNVLFDHHDKSMPHIMLFAAENIPPLQELTYHYNYELDQVRDSNGNIKKKNCYCGSDECTGRLY